MRRVLIAALLLGVAACASRPTLDRRPEPPAATPAEALASGWERIAMDARMLEVEAKAQQAAGPLVFRGALELRSSDRRFGGLSGLEVDEKGRLIAVSDQGNWFAGQLTFDSGGNLQGLVDARMASMRGMRGEELSDKSDADAEGLTRLPDGRLAVTFERSHVIRYYDLDGKGPSAAAGSLTEPMGVERLGANQGLEALASWSDGDILAVAEEGDKRRSPFWIIPATGAARAPVGEAEPGRFYGFVGADALPDGDFIVMARFYAPVLGFRVKLMRVDSAALREDPARWSATEIVELSDPLPLDNFEGVSVVANGDVARLYLISDDNFSRSQRTLLLAFDLPATPKP